MAAVIAETEGVEDTSSSAVRFTEQMEASSEESEMRHTKSRAGTICCAQGLESFVPCSRSEGGAEYTLCVLIGD